MRIAVIDIGTNTFHLIIAEAEPDNPTIIFKTNVPVKLGEDITKANTIIPEAFLRGQKCLHEFKETIDRYGVLKIVAVATSAVRSALNGVDFIAAVYAQTGIEIEVIAGEREAALIYEGVKWSGAISKTALIMDIGGGSTEFILCNERELIWKKSYDIGAARLMQSFFKSDPLSSEDQRSLREHLAQQLSSLVAVCKTYQPRLLIGSAGAFESFKEMISGNQADVVADIDLQAYQTLSTTLIAADHEARSRMKGLIPLRTDMIVMAACLVDYVLQALAIREIRLSGYDLKMGLLKEAYSKFHRVSR